MITDKYPNTPRNVDLKDLCLNQDFGGLKFSASLSILEKMQKEIVELEDLDYKDNLTQSEIDQIESAVANFNAYIQRIKEFSLSLPAPQTTRDEIESGITSFYQTVFATQTRNALIYLRQQLTMSDETEKDLRQTLINAKELESDLQNKLEKIQKDEASVKKGSGIVSSKYLSQVFRDASVNLERRISLWSKAIFGLSLGLFALVAGLFATYWNYIFGMGDGMRSEFAVFSFLLIAIVFYFLKFAIRNYNISNHLAQSNAHRANVAETLESYITGTENDSEVKNALLKEGSTAMFGSDSTGYLTKDQMEISTPVQEMITTFISDKK